MKFSEIPYKRPDKDAIIEEVGQITLRMQQAENYAQAKASFPERACTTSVYRA